MKDRLTIEEFRGLPRDEQNVRYRELSNHDKFIARMEDWQPPKNLKPMTDEEFRKTPPKGWEDFVEETLNRKFN